MRFFQHIFYVLASASMKLSPYSISLVNFAVNLFYILFYIHIIVAFNKIRINLGNAVET
jgi:hypothetical protein